MNAIVVSLKFHPGHVSHLVASYKQCEELGYTPFYYVNKGFVRYLPSKSNIVVYGENMPKNIELAIFTFPTPLNIWEIIKLKASQKSKVIYIFHEPLTKYKVYRDAGFTFIQLLKLAVGDFLEAITVKLANVVILPSKKALDYYKENKLYHNNRYSYIPLMYSDEYESRFDNMPRTYFSYIGTVAADHSFNEFLDFVCWAIRENQLPAIRFLVATKSNFDVPSAMQNSPRVTICKGRPMTDEEINAYYASTYVVWNAYARTTQSGVLAKSFMFGTPALVLRKNCNEFAHDGIEIKAIEDNTCKDEIVSALEDVLMNFKTYSSNCRNQFLKTFYYRNYNRQFAGLLK